MKKPYQLACDNIANSLSRFFNRIFSKIHVEKDPLYNPSDFNDAIVMVVSTHRSQADYFLLGWVLYNNGVKYLRIAAGDNLTSFPILGKKFLSFGAFPVKRELAFKKNYVRSLCAEVVKMMENGEPILLFPEGGRSYTGKMMELKGGILIASIIAQWKNPNKKVYILPCSISYERLPELKYFKFLQKGRELRKNKNFIKKKLGNFYYFGADLIAFGKFLACGWLGISQGEVFIDIGKPLAINELIDINSNYNSHARDEFSSHQNSVRILGQKIYDIFISLYRILPSHILAKILKEKQSISLNDAVSSINNILSQLKNQKRNTKSLDMLSPEEIVQKGIKNLLKEKAISLSKNKIKVKNQDIIDYYSSSVY